MIEPLEEIVADLAAAARELPEVAREAIVAELERRPSRSPVAADGLLADPRPVFVTLRIAGELRGCIGSLVAVHEDLVAETADRARAAAFEDPRFPPLTLEEVGRVDIEVSILGPLERISSHADLDPRRYGIEIRGEGGRRAVLLPQIPGVETVEHQIEVTRQKAGIAIGADLTIRRFAVVKIEASER